MEDFERLADAEKKGKRTFWQALERFADEPAPAYWWRSALKDEYAVVREKFLRVAPDPDPPADKAAPPAFSLWPLDLEQLADVTPKEFVLLEPAWERLGSAIARAFELPWKGAKMSSVPNTWQIAELSSLPIILTVQSEETFRGAVAALAAKRREPFALLAPTRQFMDADTEELLVPCRAGFFDLESQLNLMSSGLLVARQSGGKLFSPLLPEQRDAVTDSAAVQVFALMHKLDDGSTKRRKAPLSRVFRLLVLKGWSQEKIATECKCEPSLITARVKEIRAIMEGRSVAELQRLASRLGELEAAEKDPRARSLYRKGLTDDTGDDESDG